MVKQSLLPGSIQRRTTELFPLSELGVLDIIIKTKNCTNSANQRTLSLPRNEKIKQKIIAKTIVTATKFMKLSANFVYAVHNFVWKGSHELVGN